uniref:THD domain-containing protein n=1 Tax=Myotis lucifugus TaxID=59463 RepID=G1Q0T5_MYOLU
MGALGLEGWGRRRQGKGCLLLAVAGTTSLVTLLLAVPLTVLAVLVVAPQKQGLGVWCCSCSLTSATPGGPVSPAQLACLVASWLVLSHVPVMLLPPDISKPLPGCLSVFFLFPRHTRAPVALPSVSAWLALPSREVAETTDPGAQARAQQRLAPGTPRPIHLQPQILCSSSGNPWGPGALPLSGGTGRGVRPCPNPGLSLLSRPPGAGRSRTQKYRAGGAYGRGAPELLLEGAETVRPALDAPGRLWYASVGFGGLARLRRGERVFVNISHPALVDSRRGKTFFGAVMVG